MEPTPAMHLPTPAGWRARCCDFLLDPGGGRYLPHCESQSRCRAFRISRTMTFPCRRCDCSRRFRPDGPPAWPHRLPERELLRKGSMAEGMPWPNLARRLSGRRLSKKDLESSPSEPGLMRWRRRCSTVHRRDAVRGTTGHISALDQGSIVIDLRRPGIGSSILMVVERDGSGVLFYRASGQKRRVRVDNGFRGRLFDSGQ